MIAQLRLPQIRGPARTAAATAVPLLVAVFLVASLPSLQAVAGAIVGQESGDDRPLDRAGVLVEAEPRPDEVLTAGPEEVTLAFVEPVEDGQLRLLGEGGEAIPLDAPSIEEDTITAEVPDGSGTPPGLYLLDWDVDLDSGRFDGSVLFRVDPSGEGVVVVDRQVGSGGVHTGQDIARVLAAVGVALLVGATIALVAGAGIRADGVRRTARRTAWAAFAVALGASMSGLLLSGLPSGASWTEAFASGSLRAAVEDDPEWALLLLGLVAVPWLLMRVGDKTEATESPLWRGIGLLVGAVLIASASAASVGSTAAVSAETALRIGQLVTACLLVGAWIMRARRLAAVSMIVLVVLVGLGVGLAASGGDDFDSELSEGDLIVEVVVSPAEVGTNELHFYGLTATGQSAELDEAEAWLSDPTSGVGPLNVALFRAGPNHFLTYTAEIPFPGMWEVELVTTPAGSEPIAVTETIEVNE